ncbi:hypothetical protein [Bacillus pseudomycoides]|uniref:hypothetical protein n=1 Tax=Bacillus pseudomycoides TaxID=64104 RepID=UPI001FB4F560|nr:hypothetical protein [Bacillus pseudomycoides]
MFCSLSFFLHHSDLYVENLLFSYITSTSIDIISLHTFVIDYYIACQSSICPQIETQTSLKGILQTYIESNMKLIDENLKHVFAVIEIVSNERTDEVKLR